MTCPDSGYSLTRRKGSRATVVQLTSTAANPQTGEREMNIVVTNVRWVVKETTSYGRIYRAQSVQQDVGSTTFLMWVKDTPFDYLRPEDYIIFDGLKYQVVTSALEDTTLVITAREVVRALPKQVIEALAENSLGLEGTDAYVTGINNSLGLTNEVTQG